MPARYEQLTEFALLNEWKRGAIVGIYDGLVYLYMLNRCPLTTIVGVETWDKQPPSDNCDCDYCETSRFNVRKRVREQHKAFVFGQSMKLGNAELLNMPSEAASHRTFKHSLDFVFIERTNNLGADVHVWLDTLRPGGFMLGHKTWEPAREIFESIVVTGDDHLWWIKL
jgi:hypothetical protein